MKNKILIFLFVNILLFANNADHLIFSRITIKPTEAEMIAIYNPLEESINLSNYYLTDADKPTSSKYYYNLPTGQDYWSESVSDFYVKFPNINISAKDTLYIGLHESDDFNDYYNFEPDLSLWDDALLGRMESVNNEDTYPFNASFNVLGDNYEMLMMFYWDGDSESTIQDIDYFIWGDTTFAVNKTGVDGYVDDTSLLTQYDNLIAAHDENYTFIRTDLSTEVGEISPGNGYTNHDETSEVFNQSWESILNPNIIFGCTNANASNYNPEATTDDGSCITITHTIEEIITGTNVGYNATILGLVVGFEDIRPSGGPQVLVLQDEGGFQIDAVIWDWDVATSDIGYMVDPYDPSEYVVAATGGVDTYNGNWQFEIAAATDVIEFDIYHPQGNLIEDETIQSAKIYTAPYVIIPSIGERLDFKYSFPSNSRVVIRIFDLNGRFITSLVDRYYETGGVVEHSEDNADWDGTNHLGQIVDPGTYLIHIEAFNFQSGKTSVDVAPITVGVNY